MFRLVIGASHGDIPLDFIMPLLSIAADCVAAGIRGTRTQGTVIFGTKDIDKI